MASTYSANLRLELIGTGEQQGTWGSTTNINLGSLLEQAIGGYESITVSGAGDTTLTTADGSADQARNMTLNLVGTPGAIRSVICPAVEKIYIVKNATDGGFAVTFKAAGVGKTGVSIPNGSTVIVYVDGTDARLVSQFPVPVTQGGTGATASTGTGSVVLSASPTFTGVPLSTTAAADTNTTQLATTAYVVGQASSTTPVVDGVAAVGTSLRYARADHVHPTDTSRAPLASPSLTGTPLSTTAAADTNTTQIATTAYVVGQASSTTPVVDGTAAVGTSLRYARADHIHPTDTSRAPLASPSLTGTPLSTTAAVDTNNTQIATTAYVINQGYLKSATASGTYAPLSSPGLSGVPTAPTAGGGTNTTQIATTAFVQTALAGAASMTLLGTATMNVANPVLSGLTLTSYKTLMFFINGVSQATGGNRDFLIGTSTADDTDFLGGTLSGGVHYGTALLDLNTGLVAAFAGQRNGGSVSPLRTSSTTISFALNLSGNYSGGTIAVYGMK